MFWFVIAIVLLILGAAVFVAQERVSAGAGVVATLGVALLAIGGFTLAMDSFTVVPARNVGIVNNFGQANVTLDNGFHFVAPWAKIETIDATVQNINLDSDTKNCVTVRLANQTTACVDLTLQWNIDQHANANELWQRYRGTNDNVVGNIGKNVVERELRRSLNVVFEHYNPLAALTNSGTPSISTADLAAQALANMKAAVDRGIVVDTLLISVVHYDEVTQQKLNGYAQALADTQIATQQKLTAEQQKLANDQLAVGSSNDAGVKYQNCLNLLKDLAAKGQLQNLQQGGLMCGGTSASVIVGK